MYEYATYQMKELFDLTISAETLQISHKGLILDFKFAPCSECCMLSSG